MSNWIIKLLATLFYLGYLPFIPGTFASIAGIFLFYLIKHNIFIYLSSILVLLFLGFLFSGKAEKIFNQKDARCIVIDEISGLLLSFVFLPCDFKLAAIGFILFRLLDTLKPYPADRLQKLGGSIGIMGDDIICGLYTNIVLQAVLRLTSFMVS